MPPEILDAEPYSEPPATFPGTVLAAGILWIVIGGLALLMVTASTGLAAVAAANRPGREIQPADVGQGLGLCFAALFGIAFTVCGGQTVRGTTRDVLGNSIGSILFALLQAGVALYLTTKALDRDTPFVFILGAGYAFGSMILLVAGILGLAGRADYGRWRKGGPTTRPRRDEYD